MTEDLVKQRIAETWEALNELGDVVAYRDCNEELVLVTLLHEVAKLHVAGVMPQLNSVDNVSSNLTYYSFSHRNVVTADRLFKALGIIDEDGIPLGLPALPATNDTKKEV